MRVVVLTIASLALAACGTRDTPSETTNEVPPGETAPGDVSGTYQVTLADGTVFIETIKSDGTYTDATEDGTETEQGTWRQDGEKMCFDPEGDAPEACYAGGAPGPDGSFEVKDAKGEVGSTVKKLDTEAGPDAGIAPDAPPPTE
jgi:hypothetical protein